MVAAFLFCFMLFDYVRLFIRFKISILFTAFFLKFIFLVTGPDTGPGPGTSADTGYSL